MESSNFNIYTVLKELADEFCAGNKTIFDNVLVVGMQHILGTTVDMLAVMKEYGLKDAVIGGKRYSTHLGSAKKIDELGFTCIQDGYQLGYGRFDDCMQEVVHKIWFEALEKIEAKKFDLVIILDDGADLLRATPGTFFGGLNSFKFVNKPDMIIGIEQTRGGTNHPLFSGLPFPIIDVAGSFAKTKTEYPQVARKVVKEIILLIEETIAKEIGSVPTVGILGYGTMGKAITKCLIDQGLSVIVYDKNLAKRDNAANVIYYDYSSVLIANADIIIGCTGEDVTLQPEALSALLYSRQKKWLISTGSKDHEFNTLLRTIQDEVRGLGYVPDPLETIHYQNHMGAVLEIIRGGFPINFTNEIHSLSPIRIWPTRVALMLACMSAVYMRRHHFKRYIRKINTFMLPPEAQLLILKKYCKFNPHEKELLQLCRLTKQEIVEFIVHASDGMRLDIANEDILKPQALCVQTDFI